MDRKGNDSTPSLSARPVGIASGVRTVVAGLAALYFELALIRFVPGQIRVLGYFTNFVLLAAFLGFGLGILAWRHWPRARALSHLAPVAFLAVVGLVQLGAVLQVVPSPEEFLFLEYKTRAARIPLYPFLALSFVMLSASCAPIGHFVGQSLAGYRPLFRYGLNILGSLLGIALFVVLSILGARPWLWMVIASLCTLPGLIDAGWGWRIIEALVIPASSLLAWHATAGSIWSPYQKITTGSINLLPGKGIIQEWAIPTLSQQDKARLVQLARSEGFTIRVNDDSYQTPVDLRPDALSRRPELVPLAVQYELPFRAQRSAPREVLVLGAGAGNDVAAALRAGATRVDAVEIDPEILRLGAQHPEHPYEDPRVHVHLADARSFLARTERRFDMILFGLLDSHVLMSSKSAVRLDAYVFTKESFIQARALLQPRGILVVSHAVGTPWFYERMRATLTEAFGRPPVIVSAMVKHPIGIVYAAGDTLSAGEPVPPASNVLEDDWPFAYLKAPMIPLQYLAAMLIIAAASLVAIRGTAGRRWQRLDLHFVALGAGFMLLETRGLCVVALHLGSTWGVNAAVFAGVLSMSLLATVAAAWRLAAGRTGLPGLAYLVLGILLVLNFVIPAGTLAALPVVVRIGAIVMLVSLPMLASGVLFACSLARTGGADRALASNLVGAMFGGMAEYASMIVGFRMLLLLAVVFYLWALLTDLRGRSNPLRIQVDTG